MPKSWPTFEAFRSSLNYLAQKKFEQEQLMKEQEFNVGLMQFKLGEEERIGTAKSKEQERLSKEKYERDKTAAEDLARLRSSLDLEESGARHGQIMEEIAKREAESRITKGMFPPGGGADGFDVNPIARTQETIARLQSTLIDVYTAMETADPQTRVVLNKQAADIQKNIDYNKQLISTVGERIGMPAFSFSLPTVEERYPAPEGAVPYPTPPDQLFPTGLPQGAMSYFPQQMGGIPADTMGVTPIADLYKNKPKLSAYEQLKQKYGVK